VIWAVCHYPLILRGYDWDDQAKLGAVVFLVSTVLFSVIFGWLKDRTGSIWVPCLCHSATNAVGASLTLLWFYHAGVPVLTAYVGVLAWPALVITSIAILRFGYRRKSGAGNTKELGA
jgi:CAAX protease family protein